MSDYQRQRDNENTPVSKGGGGWRRLFRSSSPAPGPRQRQRSHSTGAPAFSRRSSGNGNGDGSPTQQPSSPTSRAVSRAGAATAGYTPPSAPTTPATPLQSNMARSRSTSIPSSNRNMTAHIEMPSIHSHNSKNSNNNKIPSYRKQQSSVSLFNSNSSSSTNGTDDDATNVSISTSSVLHDASEVLAHRGAKSMGMVDNLVNDVIGSNHDTGRNTNNTTNNSNNISPSNNGVQSSNKPSSQPQSFQMDIEMAGSSQPLHRFKSSATSDSVSLTADYTLESVTSNHSFRHSTYSSKRSSRRKLRKSKKDKKESLDEKLDTLSGVFLPCLAQIVGVIFFLRLPTITGQAGTIGATLIILTCVFSTFITSLSLSAIASNGTIKAGGPYYIISRTLGIEIGGALGVLFYLGTTLGASMHVMGAVETMIHRKKHAYQNNNMGLILSLVDSCPSQVWSLLLMFIIARIVSVGSKYVTKAANFFLVTVGLSIFSILLGTILFAFGGYDGSLSDEERAFNDNLYPNYRPDPKTGVTPTFWGLVAIFYPATTGIMAGTNRSSSLATPNKSIAIGTIGAIAVTTTLYLFLVWLLGSVLSNEILIYNKLVLTSVAFPSRIVAKIGMVTSCVGAALQCMAGAPQLLGAIAADDAIPFLKFLTKEKRRKGDPLPKSDGSLLGLASLGESTSFDKGDGNISLASEKSADIEFENSKRAVWFTWAIASIGTLLGNIDHITPILTMFYLMMYGGINLCCFLLAWVDSPGFRPQFKYFSKRTAFVGFIWCFVLAFLISWLMAILAILLLFTIFKYINISAQQSSRNVNSKTKLSSGTNWGDVLDSVKYKITTAILARVTGTENFHAKNWRPQLLTFVDTNEEGAPLSPEVLALAAQFRGGRGLNIVVSIKHGSYLRKGTFEISQHCSANLKKWMEKERLQGFCEVILTLSNFEEAVWSAVMHSGLGPVSPNTVLMSWMADWRRRIRHSDKIGEDLLTDESSIYSENENIHACSANEFVNTLKGLGNMQRAVCILKGKRFPRCGDIMPIGSTIDIYWVVDDGGLCLLVSYIISRNSIWRRNANLQVFAVTTTPEDKHHDVELAVVEFLQQIRINATVHIVSMEKTEMADDFRAHTFDVCPGGAPTLTIGEKFRAIKDDAMSTSSSVSGGQVFPSFIPLGDTACLPTNSARLDNLESPDKIATTSGFRKYVELPENSVVDLSQRFLLPETAQKFNNIIRQNSPSASLVVTHLPLPHKVSKSNEFMEYVDTMFKDVDNMLLIQGTGVEYLTTVA
eukprot:CAMPEP_0172308272 /NCGR_PEP_ID=MMETSP1058-20130122/8924_1 /TAXON_ID=83371 /ORGANISM="Detonula confervacea, Strain CCMP 353" /LENGTH=1273 /DNA_ID=CAMNT_0013020651 /DNA_START=35 /DNA_END=3856 /DNA_ORIENTATION=-